MPITNSRLAERIVPTMLVTVDVKVRANHVGKMTMRILSLKF